MFQINGNLDIFSKLTRQMAKRTTEASDRHFFADCTFGRRSVTFLFTTDDKEDGQREKSDG